MPNDSRPLIFEQDSPEKTAEYLRLSLAKLTELNLPADPLNYSLAYQYYSGKNVFFQEKLEEFIGQGQAWDEQQAQAWFNRYVIECEQIIVGEVKQELVKTVAHIFGTLTDIAGKASLSNERLKRHIDHLAGSKTQTQILASAMEILEDTRKFVRESRDFEDQVASYSHEVEVLKDELCKAKQEASHDALTGLNNRRAFDNKIEHLVNDRRSQLSQFSLMNIDIDHFKKVNDSYGHLVGDKVLQTIAKVITATLRSSDFAARIGGEEFAVLLPNTFVDEAQKVAEKLRREIQALRLRHTSTGEQLSTITVSIGLAGFRQGESVQAIFDRADAAMYRAKRAGRNRVIVGD